MNISLEHKRSLKALYTLYCQNSDPQTRMYWGCFNEVANKHRAAVKRIDGIHAAGHQAHLRHHRFDGSGTLTVQLQREKHDPPRNPATLADPDGKWRNVLRLSPWLEPRVWAAFSRPERKRRRLGTVRFRCGQEMIELPVILHRMLPADADVTGARLVVSRVAGHRTTELHVTTKIPNSAAAAGPAVALHLGWRHEEDSVRVATWRSTEPLAVPTDLAPWLVADTDNTGGVHVPDHWRARVNSYEALQAARSADLDKIRVELVSWLTEYGPAPRRPDASYDQPHDWISAEQVNRWRAARRFALLARQWRDWQPPHPKAVEMSTSLEAWRGRDRRLWESHANGRARALGQRDDAYRRITAWLTGVAGCLVIDDSNVSDLARRRDPDASAILPTAVAQQISQQRVLAAPGRLRELAVLAFKSRGMEAITVPHIGTTRLHHSCGYLNPIDDRYARSRVVRCDGCGEDYDQDSSATSSMLATSGHLHPPSVEAAREM
jgi:hypothetical protein